MSTRRKLQILDAYRDRPLAEVFREGGLAGAGGAGFPTYVKYMKPQPYHLTNAQESEPGYFIDKWIHKVYPEEFAELYQFLLDWGCRKILVAPKYKDREWFIPLEEVTGGRVLDCRGKENIINPDDYEEPILFTYTDDQYAFGKEQALIRNTTGVKLAARDLPTDHGFIVNNTETLYNMYLLLTQGKPVTRKFVHVYGETPEHIFVECPMGTTAGDLLREAGTSIDEVEEKGFVIIDGGPGWFSIVENPRDYSVTKRMNALIVVDPNYADPKRNDVRTIGKRQGYPRIPKEEQEQEPRGFMEPELVQVRLVDNPEFAIVKPARPAVKPGDQVKEGDKIAEASDEGFSVPAHASIDGTVADVTDTYIAIRR